MPSLVPALVGVLLLASSTANEAPTRAMALTVDDLPQVTLFRTSEHRLSLNRRLVGTLRDAKVPVTGFVNGVKCFRDGKLLDYQREILESWLDAGFVLGNHTWSHPDYNDLTLEEFAEDLEKGESFVQSIRGKEHAIRWFRHPYLHRGDSDEKREALAAYLAERGYREAVVSIDNAEWMFARRYDEALQADDTDLAQRIADTYVDYMMDVVTYWEGQSQALFERNISHVMLLHANTLNADYLGELIRRWRSLGYVFVSLEEALDDPAYATEDRYTGRAGISWIHRWAVTQERDPATYAGEPRVPEWVRGEMSY